jgi:predicted phage baseplate assembly protein
VPQGIEVATLPGEDEQEIIFTTDERLLIRSPELTQVRRETGEDDFNRNYFSRLDGADLFHPFNRDAPEVGDTFYLGFAEDQSISGHILQLNFTSERTEGVGIKRDDPPWAWEASLGDGRWQTISPSTYPGEENDTGGLNNPTGRLIFYLPLTMQPDLIHGVNAYWIRCRIEPRPDDPQNMYKKSPRIRNITAHTLGATTAATHAVIVQEEIIGRSSGDAGQIFQLRYKPVLALRDGETVEIEKLIGEDEETVFVPWERVDDFADSDRHDRHFTLDTASGEVVFGPRIRQPDGTIREYGAIPSAGNRIRFSRYRYGGGVIGNVPTGKLQILRTAIPYIDRVTNLVAAGSDSVAPLAANSSRARISIGMAAPSAVAASMVDVGTST